MISVLFHCFLQRRKPYPFLTAAHNEVGFYVAPLQVGVSLSSCSRFHVVVPVQVVQGGLRDVYAPEMKAFLF